jgi:hypothetical protein
MDPREEVAVRLGVPACTKCGRPALRRFIPVAKDGYTAFGGTKVARYAEFPFNLHAPADERVAVCVECRDAAVELEPRTGCKLRWWP